MFINSLTLAPNIAPRLPLSPEKQIFHCLGKQCLGKELFVYVTNRHALLRVSEY